jgi:hypothetical protein
MAQERAAVETAYHTMSVALAKSGRPILLFARIPVSSTHLPWLLLLLPLLHSALQHASGARSC